MDIRFKHDCPKPVPGVSSKNAGEFQPDFSTTDAMKHSRRRGPHNRFMKKVDREKEVLTISEMMGKGIKVKDIATLMQISEATIYRRIGKIPHSATPNLVDRSDEYQQRLTELLENARVCMTDAHYRAEKRIAGHQNSSCCPDCKTDKIAVELLRQSAAQHKLEIRALKHAGFFDHIRKDPEIILRVLATAEHNAWQRLHLMGRDTPCHADEPASTSANTSPTPTGRSAAASLHQQPSQSATASVSQISNNMRSVDVTRAEVRPSTAAPVEEQRVNLAGEQEGVRIERKRALLHQEESDYMKRIAGFLSTHKFEGLDYKTIPRAFISELAHSLALCRISTKPIFESTNAISPSES